MTHAVIVHGTSKKKKKKIGKPKSGPAKAGPAGPAATPLVSLFSRITAHLESNTTNLFNELPNMDRLTAGNFKEKDFWSAQCMQCTSRFTTKKL